MGDEAKTSEFWDFTLQSYPRDRVQQSVIALQDRFGADVNILFLCCYAAASGRGRLSAESVAAADAALDPWREGVTLRLREIRDHIKNTDKLWSLPGAADVRGKVLGAEIESERIAQGILERLLSQNAEARPTNERLSDAGINLKLYLAYLGVELNDEVCALARALLEGTLPGVSAEDYSAALS